MSYNFLMNTLDGSAGYEGHNSELSNSNTFYNGTIKNNINPRVDLKTASELQKLKFSSYENFTNTNLDEKKSRFSEKLKILLKNGGSKTDLSDPYVFSDIDTHPSGGISKTLKKTDSCISRIPTNDPKTNNATTQKSIMFSRSIRPQSIITESNDEKDCNGDSNFNKNIKLTKVGVSMYPTNNSISSNLNHTTYKLQHGNHSDRYKISSANNGKTAPSVQLSNNNRPLINKLGGKSKLQNLKSSNMNNSLKVNRNMSGKNVGQSQIYKQVSGATEKKLENKHKSLPKGKLLLNHLQKTAMLNRSGGQAIKRNTSKGCFFGMNKINEKESDPPPTSNSVNRNFSRKSLLEESLLGLKSHGNTKDFANGMKSRVIETNCTKNDHLKSLSETSANSFSSSPKSRTESLDQGKHESLQRIWNIRNKLKGLKRDHHHFGLTVNDGDYDENANSECLLFQNYWFSVSNDYDTLSNVDRKRDTKLSQLKVELRHKIKQLQWRYKDEYRDKVVELLVDSARKQPNLTAFLIRLENSKFNSRKRNLRVKPFNLLKPVLCSFIDAESKKKCEEQAMPCVKFCQQHITCSNDQLLFTACSAVRSDNTTCRAAVLNQNWTHPLCLQHKRLENSSEIPKKLLNSKPMSKPSQLRKRSRSSTGSSSRSGRSRKRKRPSQKDKRDGLSGVVVPSSISNDSSTNFNFVKQNGNIDTFKHQNILTKINPQVVSKCDIDESQEVEVGEEVLAMAADLPLELATQATKLLEEHDFTNVLNHIPADAFNDLFTEDKEEYEPTPQETEELERALEAVDKDVKSLEKLSQTQGILDTLLDEQTIAQTLAQLPEVTASLEVPQTLVPVFYQNGFSNINQLEQTLHDVNKSLTQTVLLNQGSEVISNHFVNNITIPNHADVLQS